MIKEFEPITYGITSLIETWEVKLSKLPTDVITERKNSQNRTIKQILGHLIDSASNNTHRIVHLQYQDSPVKFPNYASNGNNDRWIAIQNYQEENWNNLIQFWKYSNWHLVHVIENIKVEKLENEWIASFQNNVSLKAMVTDYLRHFELHLNEIDELINEGID
ncbi:MAG: DinB family protein [Bacteroidia bacterium]|nr:DinB family protein [Bacteroidia bacterium]